MHHWLIKDVLFFIIMISPILAGLYFVVVKVKKGVPLFRVLFRPKAIFIFFILLLSSLVLNIIFARVVENAVMAYNESQIGHTYGPEVLIWKPVPWYAIIVVENDVGVYTVGDTLKAVFLH